MIGCLSSGPDALHGRSSFLCSTSERFGSQEAVALLQKCTNFNQLKQSHAKIIRNGLSSDQLLVRKMIGLCSSYGKMDYATLLFHQVEAPHNFTWNLMIRAYTLSGNSKEAIMLYNLMIGRGFPPDKFTFPFVVKACTALSAVDKGREVHGLAIKSGFFRDMFVLNTLMDLYFKCGDKDYGCKVFERMPARNVVSWTTMISGLIACGDLDAALEAFECMPDKNVVSWSAMINGLVKNKQPQEAFDFFRRMQLDNCKPNEFTLVSLLRACTELGSLELGRWMHEYAVKNGFNLGVFLGTALIDMYSKSGSLADARKVFNEMEVKSLATWNSMITSLGVHGFGDEALALFNLMEKANVRPDAITFVGVLCACVNTGTLETGYKLFKYMTERYGIVPISEHYSCLIELYDGASIEEVSELMTAMPMKPNDNFLAEIFRASKLEDNSTVENFFYMNTGEHLDVDMNLNQSLPCFKWDAG